MNLSIEDFDYELPPGLIAQHPGETRSGSRLLCVGAGSLADRRFSELPQLLEAGDLLVFNDTRVIKARLAGEKETGGRVEVLIERVLSEHEAFVQISASKPPRPGSTMRLAGSFEVRVLAREGEFYRLRFPDGASVFELLERHGSVPLPPYITQAPRGEDEQRYQTVYARSAGAVAAPTAGLHFDESLLAALAARGVEFVYVTLHVGAGTFQPVREKNLAKHRMHGERYEIPAATVAARAVALARVWSTCSRGTRPRSARSWVRCAESLACSACAESRARFASS